MSKGIIFSKTGCHACFMSPSHLTLYYLSSKEEISLLTCWISKPTRMTEDTFSIIDNIFVTNPSKVHSGIIHFYINDHYPIFMTYKDYLNNILTQPE